jgi:cytochrome c
MPHYRVGVGQMYASRLILITAAISASSAVLGKATTEELEKDVFRAKCVGCHAIACNRNGPKLGGVLGRSAGGVTDFPGYSEVLKTSGLVWTDKTLDEFLKDPNKLVPGTKMASAGRLESAQQRKMLIRFIKRADTSLDLCF